MAPSQTKVIDGATVWVDFAQGVENENDRVRVRMTKPGDSGFDVTVEMSVLEARAVALLMQSASGLNY